MIELTLKDLQYLKMHNPPPIREGQIRQFNYFPNHGVTMFKEFHKGADNVAMEDGAMLGVLTPDGLRWAIESKVIL